MTSQPGQDGLAAVCAYLGLGDDPDSHATYATEAHRCYRMPDPTRIAPGHQTTFCLVANHVACPVFLGKSVAVSRRAAVSAKTEATRSLKVFVCHSSGDKPAVRNLHRRLVADGIDVWLDEDKLDPGMDWQFEIAKAVREAHIVIACLSESAINKEGYVQREIRFALDKADEQPEGTIFLIPLRLEACDVPERLSRWQYVNIYEADGYERLMRALRRRAETLGVGMIKGSASEK